MPLLDENSVSAIGAVGSACILGAYVLITFSKAMQERCLPIETTALSLHYQLLNFAGGVLAGASAFLTENKGAFPLAVLETIWAIIAVVGIIDIFRIRNKRAASPDSLTLAAPTPSAIAPPIAPPVIGDSSSR
jgi:hypothetical protein